MTDSIRHDIYVPCDANGFSLMASELVPRANDDPMQANTRALLRTQQLALISMFGDDYHHGRLVVGGELTEVERSEWIGHIVTPLRIPCGKLVWQGGFDRRTPLDLENIDDAYYSHLLDVPPGDYTAHIYAYMTSINGTVILRDGMGETVEAWFERTRPGRSMPAWLAMHIQLEEEYGTDDFEKWEDPAALAASGELDIEREPWAPVAYLVHLVPGLPDDPTQVPYSGWLPADVGARVPDACPLGFPSAAEEEDSELADFVEELG